MSPLEQGLTSVEAHRLDGLAAVMWTLTARAQEAETALQAAQARITELEAEVERLQVEAIRRGMGVDNRQRQRYRLAETLLGEPETAE